MPCLLLLFTLAFPRLVMVLLFLLSNFLQRAYNSLLIIVLGFIFLPLTTIVYAWVVNSHHPVEGLHRSGPHRARSAEPPKQLALSEWMAFESFVPENSTRTLRRPRA